jgi:integrase
MTTKRRPYAERGRSIRQLKSGRYQARYYDSRGIRQSATFPTKQAARAFLDRQSADKQRGTLINPHEGKMTFAALAASWLERRTASSSLRPSTLADYEAMLRLRIVPQFGHRPVSQITPSEIADWVATMGATKMNAGTIRNHLRLLRALLDRAVRDRLIPSNPAASLHRDEKPSYSPAKRHFLTAPEVERLALAVADLAPLSNFDLLVRFAARTGLRASECCALTWADVDLAKGLVSVTKGMRRVHATNYSGAPKSAAGIRTVPMGAALTQVMKEHAAALPTHPRFNPTLPVFYSGEPDRPVPYRHSADFYLRFWKSAVKIAGLPPALRFHDLRHTCASLLIHAGAPIESVSAQLGHSSPAITWQVYAHLYDDERTKRASLIDAAFGLE